MRKPTSDPSLRDRHSDRPIWCTPLVDCQVTVPASGQNSSSISPPSGAGPARNTVRKRLGSSVAVQSINPVSSDASTLTSLSLANASVGVAATCILRSTFTVGTGWVGASADDRPAPLWGHVGDRVLERAGDPLVALADVLVVGGRLGAGARAVHGLKGRDLDLGREEDAGQEIGEPDAPRQADLDRLGLDAEALVEPQQLAEPLAVAQEDPGLVAADIGHRHQRHAVLQGGANEPHAAGELDLVPLPPWPVGLDVAPGVDHDAGAAAQRLAAVLGRGRDRAEGFDDPSQKAHRHRPPLPEL